MPELTSCNTFLFQTHKYSRHEVEEYLNSVKSLQVMTSEESLPNNLIQFTITLTGQLSLIMKVKKDLYMICPSNSCCRISCLKEIILDDDGEMKPLVKKRLDILKSNTDTIFNVQEHPSNQKSINLEILGVEKNVEKARLMALSLLDELLGLDLTLTEFLIPQKFHAIVNGRKRQDLNKIMQATRTNFYFPAPFVIGSSEAEMNSIQITGEADQIKIAKDKYLALFREIESSVQSKQISCQHRKLDWLYTFGKDKIRKIMADNAVDVHFPPPFSGAGTISVSGTKSNYVDRTIRSIKQAICDCYLASIQTANIVDSAESFARFTAELSPALHKVSSTFNTEILLAKNIIDIYGTDVQTKKAYQELTSIDQVKIRDTKFQFELALEHKDFINGKKNGKINRITKTSGCRISFQENIHDVNMLIDLYSAVPSCLLAGISMLEEELPAEMSFHIPETYHKRIIGVGGKNIQKIMKRFGVYVKFSNTEEYELLGGYYENADNVICRTPSKNAKNLRDLKASIVEAVNATDLLETQLKLEGLPRQLAPWFCGPNGSVITKIAEDFRVRVSLPDKESGMDTIGLEGPESSLQSAQDLLESLVPKLSCFPVPGTPEVLNLLKSSEFLALKKRLLNDFYITTWVSTFTNTADTEYDYTFFLIYPTKVTPESYAEAKQSIVNLFNEKQVPLNHTAKSKSFPNLVSQNHGSYGSFMHFNSKLLAPVQDPQVASEGTSNYGRIFGASGNKSIRSIFEDPQQTGSPPPPPGLQRAGSEIRPKSNSVIGRPGPSNLLRPLAEKTDYLRHNNTLSRPALTMPDLTSLNVGKSSSMTGIIQVTMAEPPTRTFPWATSSFSKSLSSSAIGQEKRGNGFPVQQDHNLVSPTDIEFDQKMEYQVQALDKQNSDESDRISRVLESIDHLKYLPLFIEHEIDYQTFLALEDGDLKELGIKALGSRKKILSVIRECRENPKLSPEQRMNTGFDF